MKKYIKWTLPIIAGFILVSCSKQLDVAPPNWLVDEQIIEILKSNDEEKIKLVLNAMASDLDANLRLNSSFSGFGGNPLNPLQNQDLYLNLRGNDIVLGESTLGEASAYSFNIFYSLKDNFQPWLSGDRTFNYTWWMLAATPHTNANKVLAYLDKETVDKGIDALKDYRARCLVVRAYGYTRLMEIYQKPYLFGGKEGKGMPIYTEYKVNSPVAPASATATYDFIKNDLKEAIDLFVKSKIGEAKDGYTAKTNDIDCAVAQYLLARVSLWTGDYPTCIAACQDILKHYPAFIREDAYGVKNALVKDLADNKKDVNAAENAFSYLKKNPECILGWTDGDNAQPYQYSNFNCFAEGSGGLGENYMRMDDRLYNKIADNDFRKDIFIMDPVTYIYPTKSEKRLLPKYTNLKWAATICLGQTKRNKDLNTDYAYYRSSEVLLMLAEAQAMSTQESAAKETLNKLLAARTKAGLPALTCDNYPSMKGLSVVDMVKLQRRIEMWGENGDEYYNNKRWNMAVNRNGSTIHWSSGKTLSVDQMTYEIPDQETSTNGHWNE